MKNLVVLTLGIFTFTTLLFCEPIKPIPHEMKVNPKMAELGKKLFSDPILSKDGTIFKMVEMTV